MAILSDYEEEGQTKPETSASSVGKPFNATLDPSDPLGFLERVFEFVAREGDVFKSESLVNAVVGMVKDKVEAEERKRKKLKVEGNGNVEKKKLAEAVSLAPVEKAEWNDGRVKEEKGKGSKMEGERQRHL